MTGDCEVPPARRVKPNARREGNYNMPSVVGNGGCGFWVRNPLSQFAVRSASKNTHNTCPSKRLTAKLKAKEGA